MQVQKYPKYINKNKKYCKRRTIYSLHIDTMFIRESLCKSSFYHWHGLEFYNKVMLEGQGHWYFQFCVKCLISGLDTSKQNWRIKTFVARKKRKHFNITNCVKYFYNNELVFICFIDKMQHQTEKTDMYLEGF